MKLFTCGPVQMYKCTRDIYQKPYIHFRTKEFGNLVKDNLKEISKLIGNSKEYSLIYLASSGTGAMEATVANCMNKEDKALVINGGGFGARFCELLEHHAIKHDSINLEWNETLEEKHFLPFEGKDYTAFFVNIHETTSGQLYDMKLIKDFCKRNNLFLIVDAISSFLIDNYNMDENGIDVTIISSQKGLCCSPGIALVSLSKRMIEKLDKNGGTSFKYFDFKDYLSNIDRGQTPYTPPVLTMYEIQAFLKVIDEIGVDNYLKSIEEKSLYFRKRAKELGFTIPEYPLSNMLTPLYFEDDIALDLINLLKDEYQIFVNPCGGKLANKLLRVSHIGDTSIKDIDYLLEVLVKVTNVVRNGAKNDRK